MSRALSHLLGIVITIVLGTYFFVNYCSSCAATPDVKSDPITTVAPLKTTPKPTSFPFSITEESGSFDYNTNENFNFMYSNAAFLTPLDTTVVLGVRSLKNYLSQNNSKVINIIGYYKNDETNNTIFPNLGIARANNIKNYFVTNGISSTQMNTSGVVMETMVADEDTFLGPVAYAIAEAENNKESLKQIYSSITDAPIIVHFNTGEANIRLQDDQRQKIAMIAAYLDKVPTATCSVVGHTDNTGNRAANIDLGLERAEFVKTYLKNNGIPAHQIKATSNGPDTPIASNIDEEGRAKNRRTVITLN